jgi:hypothetical protein
MSTEALGRLIWYPTTRKGPVWRRKPACGHGGGPRFSPDAYPPPRLSPPSLSCSGLALGLELPRSAPIIVRLTLTLRAVRDTLTA